MTPRLAFGALWRGLGGPAVDVTLEGDDPVLPSSFRVGTAAAAAIAAAAGAACVFDRARSGRAQSVAVDLRHAAVECRSERHLRIDGAPPGDVWDDLAGAYPCGDGVVRLHTNFPHHRAGIVSLLDGAATRDAVARALRAWSADDFEAEATRRGFCVAKMRSFAEWDDHPQARALARAPLVRIERIGDAAPRAWPAKPRPLAGVRVVELTRVIAGPVAGRTLAAHGADVLRLLGPATPTIPLLDVDTGRGKRSAVVDLEAADGRRQLEALVAHGHVFLQSYRPDSLARRGFGAARLAELRPGIVVAELSAYGSDLGPWARKRGYDSLAQTATGFNVAEAEAARAEAPRVLPLQILDHASGHLLAAGIILALHQQAAVGGSWRVEVSLARTGQWLRSLGQVAGGVDQPDVLHGQVADLLDIGPSLTTVRHAAQMSATPAYWARPATSFGTAPPTWS